MRDAVPHQMRAVRLVLMGFGNVGQALARLLLTKEDHLRRAYSLDLRVVTIATGSHGIAFDLDGIDLRQALEATQAGNDLSELSPQASPPDARQLLQAVEAEALVECIPVDYVAGQPALAYLSMALERGMHAITANKGPVVHGLHALRSAARKSGTRFLFESAVMDGAPVFSLWRECMPGAELVAFRGILNSTTNYVLSQMEHGRDFDAAVQEAQSIGIAETDPSGDLEGWDAAIKVAALVAVLMETDVGIEGVDRRGIEDLQLENIQQAAQDGRRWKLVCSARRDNGVVQAQVAPEMIDSDDPLYHVMGTSSAVTFQSDVLGDLTITEANPGPHTTAFGMLADLLNAVRAR